MQRGVDGGDRRDPRIRRLCRPPAVCNIVRGRHAERSGAIGHGKRHGPRHRRGEAGAKGSREPPVPGTGSRGARAQPPSLPHARRRQLVSGARPPGSALAFTAHQRLDHLALLAPIVKASVTVTVDSVSQAVAHAVRLALAEPRGPVHLDLPADAARQPAVPMATDIVPDPRPAPEAAALDRAAAMVLAASRPVVVAGLQCRASDAKWLRAFCEALPAPCLTTYKAKGAIPDPHPLAMGVFTGGVLEEAVVGLADLIIALGVDP